MKMSVFKLHYMEALHSVNKIMSRLKIKILKSKTGGLHSVNKIMSHFKIALRCLQFHADLETRRRFSLNFGLVCIHLHWLLSLTLQIISHIIEGNTKLK